MLEKLIVNELIRSDSVSKFLERAGKNLLKYLEMNTRIGADIIIVNKNVKSTINDKTIYIIQIKDLLIISMT